MNRPPSPMTTRAAEGLPRRRVTVAELGQMAAAGILGEDERIELIGGEVVPMSAKGNHHEILKTALTIYWSRNLPDDLLFTTETTLRLSADTYLEPDFVFYPKAAGWQGLTAATALLVVEIADASFGIADLWVINAVSLETRIHCLPASTGYRWTDDLSAKERLVPQSVPALAVVLGQLELH